MELRPHLVYMLPEVVGGDLQVAVVEGYGAAFLQSVIRFGRLSATHHHRIGHEAVGILELGVDEPIAGTKQEDEHKDAPSHGKPREGRA